MEKNSTGIREKVYGGRMSAEFLIVGDPVMWRNSFTENTPFDGPVVVDRIEHNGKSVERLEWDKCNREALVILNNGHWAYGFQIKAVEG